MNEYIHIHIHNICVYTCVIMCTHKCPYTGLLCKDWMTTMDGAWCTGSKLRDPEEGT